MALVSGAVADRVKFGAWTAFTLLWATLVYFPVAHWVFAFSGFAAETGGWIANKAEGLFLGGVGAYDFAGGTAIHINAGVAGLALALLIRNRVGWGKEPMRPHNLTLVMIGAGILWFGWFGFNAGSALGAGPQAAGVWVNTLGATCTAMLGWLIVEKLRDGHPTSLGAASGVVAGLVAITPACATVSAPGALVVGVIAGAGCALAVGLKFKLGFDDSLDVVGVHLVGGLIGTLLIGFLADATNSPTAAAGLTQNDGLFLGGGFGQLGAQARGARRGPDLLVHRHLHHRLRPRPHDRLHDQARGRGRGHRPARARGVGLRAHQLRWRERPQRHRGPHRSAGVR